MKTASSRRAAASGRPQLAALLATRRWLMLLLLTIAWALAAIAGLLQWSRLGSADRVLLVVGAACVVGGWLLSRRVGGLWLLTGGPASLVVATAVASPAPAATGTAAAAGAWIALSVSMSHLAYAGVLLGGRRTGLASVGGAVVVLSVIWDRRPANVVAGPLAAAGGWIAIAAVAGAALALWVIWNSLLRRATADDAALAALAERTDREVEAQERSRAWRSAAILIHERLLSTIRYLLQSEDIDRKALTEIVAAADRAPAAPGAEPPTAAEAALARRASDVVRLDPSIADLPLSDDVRQAVRAAVLECALNAVQHGAATDITVSARSDGERILIEVTDNGIGIDVDAIPGMGWTAVLGEALSSVGGRWTARRDSALTIITIDVPAHDPEGRQRRRGDQDGFDQGRALMSYPLMGIGAVGVAYAWVLDVGGAWGLAFRLLVVTATFAAAVLVARRQRMPSIWSLPVLLMAAAIPWVMGAASPPTEQVASMAASVNAAGYVIIAVGVWSGRWQLPLALGLWTLGVLALLPELDQVPTLPLVVAVVNCLVAVPVTLVVARVGTRRFAAAQAAVSKERDAIRREVMRSTAAASVDQHLATSVTEAEEIVRAVADGASFDDATRHRLDCLDGLIRATIQVDPLSSGAVARAASSLVATAFDRATPATVGPLLSSPDARPLPPSVMRQLETAAAAAERIEVRSFTDGRTDYLAVRLVGDHLEPWLPIPAVLSLKVSAQSEQSALTIAVSRDIDTAV